VAEGPWDDLHIALIARMSAASVITSEVGDRIYDEPPQDVRPPYVRIGRSDLRPFRTSGKRAHDIGFSIEVHSKPVAGRDEAWRILNAVIATLDDGQETLALDDHRAAWVDLLSADVSRRTDGETYLGIAVFEAVLDETD